MRKTFFLFFCLLFLSFAADKSAAQDFPRGATNSFEKQVLAELNLARQNPLEYAGILSELRKNYRGRELRLAGNSPIVTAEGAAAVDDAIAFLQSQKPLGAVTESNGLHSAAQDHLRDLQTSGKTGHRGSDGSFPETRIELYGEWQGEISEIIKYGANTPREVVIAAIIDDGDAARPHRQDIFNENLKIAGVAFGRGGKYENLSVIVMSGNLIERASGKNNQTATASHSIAF